MANSTVFGADGLSKLLNAKQKLFQVLLCSWVPNNAAPYLHTQIHQITRLGVPAPDHFGLS